MNRDPHPLAPPEGHPLPGTGPQRQRRPLYRDGLPPCNHACGAGEDIQGWIAHFLDGRPEDAWRHLVRDNPLPAVFGRICYHPCEAACNRGPLDGAVAIHALERHLGDLALEHGWKLPLGEAPPSGKRVLIIGAGPCGLSAAWQLRRRGHEVEIRDAGPAAGGMMHVGIPAYRLPRAVLDAEVARLLDTGIRLTLNHKVEDLEAERRAGGFDAVLIAIGAHIARRIDIPARDAARVLDALSLLGAVERGAAPKLGRRVAVYGGGNTALDAARTARRLGAEDTLIIYRRDRAHMPAHDFEVAEAAEEGIQFRWLRSVRAVEGDGRIVVEEMTLDEQGRPRPTGRLETLEADALILALGQDVDTEFLRRVPGLELSEDGGVRVDECFMTGAPGVFAGGDVVPGPRSATVAAGHGKRAARHIDAHLRGTTYRKPPPHPLIGFDRLRLWYWAATAAAEPPKKPVQARLGGFDEIRLGLDAEAARREAARCLSCGNCFACDGCLAACPERAIERVEPPQGALRPGDPPYSDRLAVLRYRVDLDRCTGCAVCAEQCPCNAIEMIPETSVPPS